MHDMRKHQKTSATVARLCEVMESLAPTGLAQSWDNVGLLAGDGQAPANRVLACIDLTSAVVDEAVSGKADLILTYHPPIFKPISSLRADSNGPDAAVYRCIRNGIAIYATHTALDAADGGTNDVLASLCGIKITRPIEYVDRPGPSECKLVVTVSPRAVERVSNALFEAGAGHIGDYSRCSYRIAGEGTFFGGESTRPAVGAQGRMEHVEETRLEVVVESGVLPAVVAAMIKAHPYEEPAFDIYPLKPRPVRGIGRYGRLTRPTLLHKLARKLKRDTGAATVQSVGPPDRTIDRAVVVAGAAGSLPFRIPLTPNDVIITGEIRHHDALAIQRLGCTAIALGHWASERPVLNSLADRLRHALPGVSVDLSAADLDPFESV